MAITATARGNGNAQASSTTLAFSPSGNFASGSWAVLVYAVDNSNTNGTAHTSITVTDSNGNTWTRRVSALNDPGAADAGVEGAIFTTPMDGGTLTTGSTITITTSTASTAKACNLWEVIPDGGFSIGYDNAAAGTAQNASAAPSVTTASITSGNIVIAGVFGERGQQTVNDDADSSNGSWSTGQQANSSTGVGVIGVFSGSQYKVVTGTATQTYNPTLNFACDLVTGWVSLTQTAGGSDVTADVPVGVITFTGISPTLDRTALVPVSTLSFTGLPAVAGQFVDIAAGVLSFTGVSPTLEMQANVAVGGFTFTGVSPLVDIQANIGVESLLFTGVPPTANQEVSVPVGAIAFFAGPRNEIVEIYQNDATGGNISISCSGYFFFATASIKASAAVWQAAIGTAAQVTKPNSTTIRFEFGAGVSSANANTEIPPVVINVNSTDGTPTVAVIQHGCSYPVTASIETVIAVGSLAFSGVIPVIEITANVTVGGILFTGQIETPDDTIGYAEGDLMIAPIQGILEPVVTECALMDIPIQGILVQTD